jgi:hypothetical protein
MAEAEYSKMFYVWGVGTHAKELHKHGKVAALRLLQED